MGGDDLPPILGQKPQRSLHQAAHDHRAYQGGIAVVGGNGAQHRHEGKADAHNHREPGPHLPDGIELDQRGDARHEHGVLEQDGHLGLAEGRPGGGGNQGNGGQVGNKHCQNVLEPEGDGLSDGYPSVQLVDVVNAAFRGLPCLIHSGRFLSPYAFPAGRCRRELVFHYMHKGRPLSNKIFVFLSKNFDIVFPATPAKERTRLTAGPSA